MRLSRRKIQQMIDTDAANRSVRVNNNSSGGDESGGGSGGGSGVTWWQYSPEDDTITFIKRIASAVFNRLRITTRLIFGDSDEAETYITGIADEQTSENSVHDIVTPAYGKEKYLSRENDDTAQGFIRFIQGMQVGRDFVSGILGEGGVFRKDADGKTYIETDKLYVRMKAYFDSVEIREYIHTSGNRIASPAQGFTCSRVEWLDTGGNILEQVASNLSSVEKFRCYWRVDDGERKTENQFVVGDLAFCQNATVNNGSLRQKRFWRLVVGRNNGTTTTDDGEAWIDLSNAHDANGDPVMTTITWNGQGGTQQSMSVLSFESGSDTPSAEDDICMLGNVRDTTRQGAIIEYVSGENAPSYQIYQDIGSDPEDPYTLVGKNYIGLGYNSSTARAYLTVYGDTYIGARDEAEGGYVRYDEQSRLMEVKGRLNVGSTLSDGRDVNALGTSHGNILLNTSFTGDYDSEDVDTDTDVTPDTVIYSDPLRHWESEGVTVIESSESQSGYAAIIAADGSLSQTVELEEGKWYVLSFRGKGGTLSYSVGGVNGTLALKTEVDSYDVPFVCGASNDGLTISASSAVTLMEMQLCEGNLPTAWRQNYQDGEKTMAAVNEYKYISNAIKNASTDIIGGLILSQIIKVGNYRNKQMIEETGGMSGAWMDDNSPFLWGGGDMSQAIYTIMKYASDPSYVATQQEVDAMAKFVVTHGGRAILNDIILRGYIYAKGGRIGGFSIGDLDLTNINYDAGIAIQDAAVNPTQVSRIGKDAVDEMTGKSCSLQAESTQPGTFNTALYLKAEGATYNYAFHGSGNGVLNGLMFGYKTKSITVSTSSQSLGSMILQDGSTILVTGSHGGNHTTNPPLLSAVRNCLGISGTAIPFSIEVEVINLTSGNLNIFFRNYTGYTSDEYPYLMSNNGNVESGGNAIITITPGGYLKLRLVYVNDSKAYRAHRLVYNHE